VGEEGGDTLGEVDLALFGSSIMEMPEECDNGVRDGGRKEGRKEGKAMRLIILKSIKKMQNMKVFHREKEA
jgi:hypothetical protein